MEWSESCILYQLDQAQTRYSIKRFVSIKPWVLDLLMFLLRPLYSQRNIGHQRKLPILADLVISVEQFTSKTVYITYY